MGGEKHVISIQAFICIPHLVWMFNKSLYSLLFVQHISPSSYIPLLSYLFSFYLTISSSVYFLVSYSLFPFGVDYFSMHPFHHMLVAAI